VPKACSRRCRSLPREPRPRTCAMAPHDTPVLDVNKACAPNIQSTTDYLRKLALQSRKHLSIVFARMYHSALGSLALTALSVCVCFTHGPVLRVQSRRAQCRQIAIGEIDSYSIRTSGSRKFCRHALHERCNTLRHEGCSWDREDRGRQDQVKDGETQVAKVTETRRFKFAHQPLC